MGPFSFMVAAALLPAAFAAAAYFISFRRISDDQEIRARKRWKLSNRGNVVFLISVIGGLVAVAEGCRETSAVAKILISYIFILITFTPFMIVLGAIDRRVRGVEFPLGGYIKFQYFFFFGRWSSLLVVVALLSLPVSLTTPDGGASFAGAGTMIGGAVLFILCSLYQMRVAGRLTGALVSAEPDDGPAGDIALLSEKAGIRGTKVLFMETFGYPFYNAFAAPGKTIYITRPLLSVLSREELSAVAAHEIGHLTTMRKRTALILTLMTACVVALWFLVPRIPRLPADISSLVVEIVIALVFFLIAVYTLGTINRRFESRADAAAAELTGGPEQMVAALEKIYRLNMLPRRFGKKGSESASHPSLERRVAELRGEKLPSPRGRAKRILILLACIVIVFIAILLLRTYRLGERYIDNRGYQFSWVDVVTPLEDALMREPDNFEILKRVAIEYYLIEEDDSALACIDRALVLKRDPGLLMLRGLLLNFRGDRAGALAALEEAVRAGESTLALKWAAILAAEAGDEERARGFIDDIARVRPDDPFIREMKNRPAGGWASYPFAGYGIAFQRNGAAPLEAIPLYDMQEE